MFQTPKGMSSFLPHYLYALVYWIEENNFDPYLIVNRQAEGVEIPTSVPGNDDGTIALNLASRTRDAQHFYFTENHFEYKTAFNGKRTVVKVPYSAIYAVTARGCTEWDGENVIHLLNLRDGKVQQMYVVMGPQEEVPTSSEMQRIGQALVGSLLSPVDGDQLAEEFSHRLGTALQGPHPDVVQPTQSHESHPDVVENTTSAAEPASNVVHVAFGQRKKS